MNEIDRKPLLKRKNTFFSMFSIIIKSEPVSTTKNLILYLMRCALDPLQVIITAAFINNVVNLLNNSALKINIILCALGLFLCQLYDKVSLNLIAINNKKVGNKLRLTYRVELLKKCSRLEYKHYEDPDTCNLISRVISDPNMDNVLGIFSTLLDGCILIVEVLFIFGVLFKYAWWSAASILFLTVILCIIAYKSGKAQYAFNREVSELTRKMNYYSDVLLNREAVQERILFGYTDDIDERFKYYNRVRTNKNLKTLAFWQIRSKLNSILMIIFSLFVMLALFRAIKSGTMTIGLYISIIGYMLNFVNSYSTQISNLVQNGSNINEFIKDVNKFNNLDEINFSEDTICDFVFESIEFRNVVFKYPNTERIIIDNFNYKFERNKHYAIVGANGAGKSTLVKLMLGLYKPDAGEILINGRNINEFTNGEIMSIFAVVLQDFVRYEMTISENITMGSNKKISDSILNEVQGIVNKSSKGLNTFLGKLDEQGIDLSGGEWQKVAMARCLYKDSPVTILDEPTSAMSPIDESKIYHKFAKIASSGTTVLITHRLGSIGNDDIILVLDAGKLVDTGVHKDLMQCCTLYSEMFAAQRSWYLE